MHCDDKRMLLVLEEQIKSCWKRLQESGYEDAICLKDLNDAIIDYNQYKKALNDQ